jgi:RNA polymerase sigma-70 factor (ECF subfamily)
MGGEIEMSTMVRPFPGVAGSGEERFEQEVLVHLDRVYAGARQLAADRASAEALVQRTFDRAYLDFHWARPSGSVRAWLYGHLVAAWFEQDLRGHARPRPAAPRPRSADEVVGGALDGLAPIVRITVYLADAEGLSKAEIARITEVPAGIVETRLRRAHAHLADRLGDWLQQTRPRPAA